MLITVRSNYDRRQGKENQFPVVLADRHHVMWHTEEKAMTVGPGILGVLMCHIFFLILKEAVTHAWEMFHCNRD